MFAVLLGALISVVVVAGAHAAPPQPINPVLAPDESTRPLPLVRSTQTYEFTDPRPFFNIAVGTTGQNNPFFFDPKVTRTGPDESGNYHFFAQVVNAPVNRTLIFVVSANVREDGVCGGDFCEGADYYARTTGPPPKPFREIGLVAKQSGCQVTSRYSFVASVPAILEHSLKLYSRIKGQKRQTLRASTFRGGVFIPAASSVRQTRALKPLNLCTSFMRKKLKRLQQQGASLTFEARANLRRPEGKPTALRKRTGKLKPIAQ